MFPLLLLAALIVPAGHVTDTAQMLRPDSVAQLERTLTDFEQSTGSEVAVATIPSLGSDRTIETYANELFTQWGIGKKKEDNGVLLLISRDDHQMRIEVGYGLEPVITDIESAHIISDVLTPAFQAGDYDAGVQAAAARITDDISRGAPPVEPKSEPWKGIGFSPFILYAVVVFFGSVLARSKSWWAGGIVGAVIGLLFFGSILALGIFAILGLVFDYAVSKTYKDSKNRGVNPPWWIGGGRGPGGFGGGGGFGGFGGGSSGGGGASGRW